MYVMLLTGAASLILLSVATALMMRSNAKPPVPIRTPSHRSQEEYAFKHRARMLRRTGWMFLMAGAMTLGLCLTVGLWTAIGSAD